MVERSIVFTRQVLMAFRQASSTVYAIKRGPRSQSSRLPRETSLADLRKPVGHNPTKDITINMTLIHSCFRLIT